MFSLHVHSLLRFTRFLTDKGIDYLREYLNLPSEIVPATLKKSTRPMERRPLGAPTGDRPPRRFGDGERPPREGGGFGGREGYRSDRPPREGGGFGRGGGGGGDKAGAPGTYQPQFGGGGFGRGQ